MNRLLILSAFPFLLLSIPVKAQKIHVQPHIGFIAGSPYFPPPEGATGKPGTGLLLGGEIAWSNSSRFGARIGMFFAEKGSTFASPVSGKYDAVNGLLGISLPLAINVNYTGTVNGAYDMTYLDIPMSLSYRLADWFSLGLGYQYSLLMEGKMDGSADISVLAFTFRDQEFDQSALLRQRDHAFLLESRIHLLKYLDLTLRSSIGLTPMMDEDPESLGQPKNYFLGCMLGITPFSLHLKTGKTSWFRRM